MNPPGNSSLTIMEFAVPERFSQDSGRSIHVQTLFFRREHDAGAPESVQEKSGVHTTNLSRSPDDVHAPLLTSILLFSVT